MLHKQIRSIKVRSKVFLHTNILKIDSLNEIVFYLKIFFYKNCLLEA